MLNAWLIYTQPWEPICTSICTPTHYLFAHIIDNMLVAVPFSHEFMAHGAHSHTQEGRRKPRDSGRPINRRGPRKKIHIKCYIWAECLMYVMGHWWFPPDGSARTGRNCPGRQTPPSASAPLVNNTQINAHMRARERSLFAINGTYLGTQINTFYGWIFYAAPFLPVWLCVRGGGGKVGGESEEETVEMALFPVYESHPTSIRINML